MAWAATCTVHIRHRHALREALEGRASNMRPQDLRANVLRVFVCGALQQRGSGGGLRSGPFNTTPSRLARCGALRAVAEQCGSPSRSASHAPKPWRSSSPAFTSPTASAHRPAPPHSSRPRLPRAARCGWCHRNDARIARHPQQRRARISTTAAALAGARWCAGRGSLGPQR